MESDVSNVPPESLARLRELIALISASGGAKLLQTCSDSSYSSVHVGPERLWQVLERVNLNSLLYSPLSVSSSANPLLPDSNLTYLDEFRMRRFGRSRGSGLRDFVMCLKSLSHKWSVCGHRYVDSDAALVPCPVYCSILDSSGRFVISGADDHLIKIWEVKTGLLKASLYGHHAEVCDIALSPCDEYLASLCSEDSTVFVWRRTGQGIYTCQHKLVEIDPVEVSRRLTPLYMSFYPECPSPANPLKLVIAYTNGTVVISEISSYRGSLLPFNQIFCPLGSSYELKSFCVIQPDLVLDSHVVHLLVGLNKPNGTEKYVYGFSVRKRTPPAFLPHVFPSSIKSPISHLSVAHSSWSFVASDDEVSTVVLFSQDKNIPTEFSRTILLKSLVSGGAHLADGYPLFARMEELAFGRVTNQINRSLKVTVDITLFSKNDEFVFCTIACVSGEDSGMIDNGNCYCCLVFRVDTGNLVFMLGLEQTKSNIFNVVNLDVPAADVSSFETASLIATGSHDGQLVLYLVSATCVEKISEFNINTHGSNIDRSILDCSVSTGADGDIVCVVSDSLGSVSLFAALPWKVGKPPPAEQFLANDYLPDGADLVTGARTSVADQLCDARMVRLDELEVPTPACFEQELLGSGYNARWGARDIVDEMSHALSQVSGQKKIIHQPSVVSDDILVSSSVERARLGRPPLSEEERIRRASALQALANARARSERTVRRHDLVHEDELELYQNSEIDDSDFSSSSSSSAAAGTRLPEPRPARIVAPARKYTLQCNYCGALREVTKEKHDDYQENGKRVRCRWIGFSCDEDAATRHNAPSVSSNAAVVAPRKKRLSLPLSPVRNLRPRTTRRPHEDSENDEVSETATSSSEEEEPIIPTRRRSSRRNNTREWI